MNLNKIYFYFYKKFYKNKKIFSLSTQKIKKILVQFFLCMIIESKQIFLLLLLQKNNAVELFVNQKIKSLSCQQRKLQKRK